jgi:hypothetical protein
MHNETCPACDASAVCVVGCPLASANKRDVTVVEPIRVRREMLTAYDAALMAIPTRGAVKASGNDWSAMSAVGGASAFFARLAEVETDNVNDAVKAAMGV